MRISVLIASFLFISGFIAAQPRDCQAQGVCASRSCLTNGECGGCVCARTGPGTGGVCVLR